MQFALTDEQLLIKEMAAKFTADKITPFVAEWDEKHIFPRETLIAAGDRYPIPLNLLEDWISISKMRESH